MTDTPHSKKRRPYEKPLLRVFDLKAEEVLSKGCKLSTGGPSWQGPGPVPFPGCSLSGCFGPGS